MSLDPAPEYTSAPSIPSDTMTVEEFRSYVKQGAFTDHDGYGHPVRDGKAAINRLILPSKVHSCIPADATHVVWHEWLKPQQNAT